jgi:glucose/arabinose dehydrogenase
MLQHLSAAPRTLHARCRLHMILYGLLLALPLVHAASVPAGFNDRQVASGFRSPTSMGVLPDGRVLVVEQNGVIRLVKEDALQSASFYTVQNVDSFSERGCLGVTADPNFAVNQYVYLYCTVKTASGASRNRVLRVTASGDVALPGSETTILELPDVPQGVQWHMGGPVRFGVDGKLYVAVGGHENLRTNPLEASFSQNLASPFGKVLRINPDGSFPSDNPYFNTPNAYRGIYLLGLRNPYSVDVQPNTGLLYINDVGAGSVEEINQGVAGANYAWPIYEGRNNDPRFTNAVFEYGRSAGCAITGGSFYNPMNTQFPSKYVGKYLFSDYCSGWIRMIDPANPGAGAEEFATGINSPVGMGVTPDGSLYYLARQGVDAAIPAMLGKISVTDRQGPRLSLQPRAQTIFLGNPVTFRVDADSATNYQWRRNGADIPGATAPSYTIPQTTMADNGAVFSVLVGNAQGRVESDTAALTVTTNRLPAPIISSPEVRIGFAPGDKIGFAGSATDAEDGTLAASALSWKVDFMHDTHSHPFYPATSGVGSGEFTVPTFDAEAANIWLRLSLSATDSAGQTITVARDIYPDTQLSDIDPIGTSLNGLGAVERNLNNGGAAQGDGEPIRLDSIAYAKGLGMHAPAEVQYDLAAACTGHLIADVGIDDTAGSLGSVIFQVYLDNEKVFDSGLMRGSDLRKAIYTSVAGKSNLRLVVSDNGDGNASDLANWGGIRVTGCAPSIRQPRGTSGGSPIVPPVAAGDSGGGGGGCAIGGDGRFDPVLPGLLALALGAIAWRRRSNGSPRP